jgi:hypothetical protein
MSRRQAPIRDFSVKGKAVSAITKLTPDSANILDHDPPSTGDGQTLCQYLGGFVWANPNRGNVEKAAPLNPLYDDIARLRIVRANLAK